MIIQVSEKHASKSKPKVADGVLLRNIYDFINIPQDKDNWGFGYNDNNGWLDFYKDGAQGFIDCCPPFPPKQ